MEGKVKLYYIGDQNGHEFYRASDGQTYYKGRPTAELTCNDCDMHFIGDPDEDEVVYVPDGNKDAILCECCVDIYAPERVDYDIALLYVKRFHEQGACLDNTGSTGLMHIIANDVVNGGCSIPIMEWQARQVLELERERLRLHADELDEVLKKQ